MYLSISRFYSLFRLSTLTFANFFSISLNCTTSLNQELTHNITIEVIFRPQPQPSKQRIFKKFFLLSILSTVLSTPLPKFFASLAPKAKDSREAKRTFHSNHRFVSPSAVEERRGTKLALLSVRREYFFFFHHGILFANHRYRLISNKTHAWATLVAGNTLTVGTGSQ